MRTPVGADKWFGGGATDPFQEMGTHRNQ